jgi:thiol-disulfide isomerase/thioredoxin
MIICFFAILLSSCGGVMDAGEVAIGSRAPSFSLRTIEGNLVTSRSLEGNLVVLNFWATWCPACTAELPDLKQVAATSGANIIGIAIDKGGVDTVKPFVERHGISDIKAFTVLLGDEELLQRFNGVTIPYTLLLDRSQRVVKIVRGPITREALEKDLRAINQGA